MTHADVDLRKLRYFVAVAEELNFGRAAQRLHIAQPVLSRQIQALERELDAQLFVRDKRRTRLTPAGEQLVADAELVLAGAEALRRRVAQAASAAGTFTVGFMPGLTVTGPVRAFGDAHPGLTVEVLRTSWNDQVSVLHDGRADVGYVRLPIDAAGLEVRPLFSERRMAVVGTGHRLAGRTSVNIADLADEHLLQHPDTVPEWGQVARETRGRRETPPPEMRSVEEKLEHVAAGRGISILPESTATYYQRPDVAYVPIADIPPGQVALAWVAARRDPLIAGFAALAVTMR
ncbi:LysR family transcriptional regulator [Planotetraspora kaengkrachanensis]|uniref:LysR family transcriptional regulator n=1 Tax=Planotetraspora kaengkrachanensis TaxID=575193 RepID=A0A8J3PRE4_9ACTN|nr:LysR substrate-binding domain-containing protein [Planotetraspora kaengkrachanensis]GIG79112.1 LysR family transcriptional regulator [Planotetraspora kaengkrachanensis]